MTCSSALARMPLATAELIPLSAAGRQPLFFFGTLMDLDILSYVLARPGQLAEVSKLFDPHQAPPRLEEHLYFGDFVLNGEAVLGDVAAVYGVDIPPEHAGKTLGRYLDDRSHGRVVVGDRAPLGNALLVVREVREGRVTQVGLKVR